MANKLSIAKAHEGKLEEDLQVALEDAHYQESQAKKFEGEVTEKEGYITHLENRFSKSTAK